MKQELPELNRRVKLLVDHFTQGNVSKFVKKLNEGFDEPIVSQQRFNRIFNIDTRTGKYPAVPSEVTTAIINALSINGSWLLTGEGEMISGEESPVKSDDPELYWKAKAEALEIELAQLKSLVYGMTKNPRPYEVCVLDIEDKTKEIMKDLRRSSKK